MLESRRLRLPPRMRIALSLLIVSSLAWVAHDAMALGFGRIDSATVLGQRLDFASQVSVEPQDALTDSCVSAEVTAGDSRLAPEQVQVRLTGPANATQKTVRVTTSVVIDEPIVSVNLTIGCTSRVSRRFVVFVDPPLINLARAEPSPAASVNLPAVPDGAARSPAGAAPANGTAQTAVEAVPTPPPTRLASAQPVRPRPAPTRTEAAPRADPPRRPAPRRSSSSEPARPRAVAVAAAPARPRPAATTPAPTPRGTALRSVARAPTPSVATSASAASSPGSRLQLDPPIAAIAPAPVAASAASAAAPAATLLAAAAASPAASAASAPAPSEAVLALEADLKRLRDRDLAMQRSIATLESRLKELEGARSPDSWLGVLAVMAALLALIGVAWLWMRSRAAGHGAWWSPVPVAATADEPEAVPAQVSRSFAVSEQGDGVVEDAPDALANDPSGTSTGSFAMTLPGEPVLDDPTGTHPRGELSVEELFDLEQQADFFLALGQDEAAIDLLLGHARGSGASSPMPYLKLIEIYRQRGDREGYEATRARFNRRFNALIGEWDQSASDGQALEDFPEMVAPLERAWPDRAAAVRQLEAWIWRSDTPGPRIDLGAYRDILFLYTVARDLLDRSSQAERVDVALPLFDEGGGGAASHVAQLMASTIPMRVQDEHGHALDANIVPDIDLSEPGSQTAPTPVPVPPLPAIPEVAPATGKAAADPAAEKSNEIEFHLSSDFLKLDPPADPKQP